MRKFLNLELKKSAPEIPQSLDQRILAAAAMRANGMRRRRLVFRFALPATTGIAAAAAALLVSGVVFHHEIAMPAPSPITTGSVTVIKPESNMLALSDMTALEQHNYTIALVSENAWDEDLSSI